MVPPKCLRRLPALLDEELAVLHVAVRSGLAAERTKGVTAVSVKKTILWR